MSIESWSEDLAALLEVLSIDRTIIVGLSMGGMVAQHFAAQHPGAVSALVLMDTASDYEPEMRRVWEQRATTAERQGMAPLVDPTIARWFTPRFVERNSAGLQRVKRSIAAMDPRHYAEGCRALAALNTAPLLHRITCPTLVVVGEHDRATPRAQSERIVESIAGSELIEIADAAHCPPVERPSDTTEVVRTFLENRAVRSSSP